MCMGALGEEGSAKDPVERCYHVRSGARVASDVARRLVEDEAKVFDEPPDQILRSAS